MFRFKNRIKNIGFWVSLSALIPAVAIMFFDYHFPPEYETVANSLIALLTALGIVNDPTTSNKGFLDDEKELDKE